jgi:hypothetical protein
MLLIAARSAVLPGDQAVELAECMRNGCTQSLVSHCKIIVRIRNRISRRSDATRCDSLKPANGSIDAPSITVG